MVGRGYKRKRSSSCPLVIQFFVTATVLALCFTSSSLFLLLDEQETTTTTTDHGKKVDEYNNNKNIIETRRKQQVHYNHPNNNNNSTNNILSSNKQQQQQEYHESSFVYANKTYTYRYSKQLFDQVATRKTTTTKNFPKIIFGICSNAQKPFIRNIIRQKSWSLDSNAHLTIYIVASTQFSQVEKEFWKYNDLLWLNIDESYREGLTPKTLTLLDFGGKLFELSDEQNNEFNKYYDYLFKTDDDVYVNATHIGLELLQQQQLVSSTTTTKKVDAVDYYGFKKAQHIVVRNQSDPWSSKWYMSREEYPNDYYPIYAAGTGYALSRKFAICASRRMHELMKFMPWEDVAVGILAQLCNIQLVESNKNWDHFSRDNPNVTSELDYFNYERYKLQGKREIIKILHEVPPWYMEPLYKNQSLVEAKKAHKKKKPQNNKKK